MLSFRPPVPFGSGNVRQLIPLVVIWGDRASRLRRSSWRTPCKRATALQAKSSSTMPLTPAKVLRSQVDQVYVWTLLIEFLSRILEIRGGLAPLGPGWKWSRVAVRPSLNGLECHQLSRTQVLLIMGRPRPIWFLLETQFSVVSTR